MLCRWESVVKILDIIDPIIGVLCLLSPFVCIAELIMAMLMLTLNKIEYDPQMYIYPTTWLKVDVGIGLIMLILLYIYNRAMLNVFSIFNRIVNNLHMTLITITLYVFAFIWTVIGTVILLKYEFSYIFLASIITRSAVYIEFFLLD